jgi:hypothetical protein
MSLLKSTASEEEKTITDVILFGVDKYGQYVNKYYIDDFSPSGNSLTIHRAIKNLYAIANPSQDLKDATPANVSDLLDLAADFSDQPEQAGSFLMSGIGEVKGYSAEIELFRAVAKIEVIGKWGFEIASVEVEDSPDKGYVFGRNPIEVPSGAGAANYVLFEPVDDTIRFYVAENYATSLTPTQFVVNGDFESSPIQPFTFSLKKENGEIDIKRNTKYQVGITPQTILSGEVEIEVLDWDYEIADTLELTSYKDGIKILAIGNSFSQDAMYYMYDLLEDLGVEGEIVIANAHIDAASLQVHATHVIAQDKAYLFSFYDNHGEMWWESGAPFSLDEIINWQNYEWDVIILQQFSADSGIIGTYDDNDLGTLITFVQTNSPKSKLGWHMTWAYASSYYVKYYYGNHQRGMYDSICHVVQRKILRNSAFDLIIPSGTAIQNARGHFGDVLNSDGTHLGNLGRYIAAAMWIKTITGLNIANLEVPYQTIAISNRPAIEIDAVKFDKIVQYFRHA